MSAISQFNSLSVGQIGPIKWIGDGVCTAEAIAPTGEKMYFAMESIEDSDKIKWITYKNSATILVNGECCGFTCGSLVELGSRVNDIIQLNEFLATRTHPHYWTSDQLQFERLCDKLQERSIVEDSPKAQELSGIPYASNGVNVNTQTHMVYVSKSPITARSILPQRQRGSADMLTGMVT